MESKAKRENNAQSGFTLIEIIAVLVVLGILAAVAVPRFTDLQDQARSKSYEGVVAAVQTNLVQNYAKYLLQNNGNTSDAWTNLVDNATDGTICQDVTLDGFDDLDTDEISCTDQTGYIEISVDDGTISASGNFTNPNS